MELIVLTDEVDAEAVVRRFVDEREAGRKVEMTGGSKRIIGPQRQSAVSGGARRSRCTRRSSGGLAVATAVAGDQQDTELGRLVVFAYAEHATDPMPVHLGKPGSLAAGVMISSEVGDDASN